MTGPARDSDRLFCYAMARQDTLGYAIARSPAPIAAEYSPSISVAYASLGANAASYDLASPRKPGKDDRRRARSAARILAAGRAGADVYATRQSRPTPSATGRHPGEAGGAGVLCRGSEDVTAKEEALLLIRMGDRKSTRLNSSHVKI